eukprot:g2645.t1
MSFENVLQQLKQHAAEAEQLSDTTFKAKFDGLVRCVQGEIKNMFEKETADKKWVPVENKFGTDWLSKGKKVPIDEDALREMILGILQKRMKSIRDIVFPTLSAQKRNVLCQIFEGIPIQFEKLNLNLSKEYNEGLKESLLARCVKDFKACENRLRLFKTRFGEKDKATMSKEETAAIFKENPNTIYHSFSRVSEAYVDEFIQQTMGVDEVKYQTFEGLKSHVNTSIKQLRDICFDPAFLRERMSGTFVGPQTRRCPNTNCRIAWTKDGGCQNVFCGWSAFHDAPESKTAGATRAVVPCRGINQQVHGCGHKFDFRIAEEVRKEEWDVFFAPEAKPVTVKTSMKRRAGSRITETLKSTFARLSSYIWGSAAA